MTCMIQLHVLLGSMLVRVLLRSRLQESLRKDAGSTCCSFTCQCSDAIPPMPFVAMTLVTVVKSVGAGGGGAWAWAWAWA